MKRFRKLIRDVDHGYQVYKTEDAKPVVFDAERREEWARLEVLFEDRTTAMVEVDIRVTAWEIPKRKEYDWHTYISPLPVAVFNVRGVEMHAPLERFAGVAVEPFLAADEEEEEGEHE